MTQRRRLRDTNPQLGAGRRVLGAIPTLSPRRRWDRVDKSRAVRRQWQRGLVQGHRRRGLLCRRLSPSNDSHQRNAMSCVSRPSLTPAASCHPVIDLTLPGYMLGFHNPLDRLGASGRGLVSPPPWCNVMTPRGGARSLQDTQWIAHQKQQCSVTLHFTGYFDLCLSGREGRCKQRIALFLYVTRLIRDEEGKGEVGWVMMGEGGGGGKRAAVNFL